MSVATASSDHPHLPKLVDRAVMSLSAVVVALQEFDDVGSEVSGSTRARLERALELLKDVAATIAG